MGQQVAQLDQRNPLASCNYKEKVGEYAVATTGELIVHRKLSPQE